MNNFNDLIIKNDLIVKKYTLKGKALIIDTPKDKYVLKSGNNVKLFKYLYSKEFDSFPKVIDYNRENTIYEYIDDIKYDEEERALDLIKYIALLHKKTSYYKEITEFEYKKLYESLISKIDESFNYYNDLVNIIENKIYPSPSEYLLLRNISFVFSLIYYSKNKLNEFYEKYKNEKRKRVVTLHNNVDTSNLLKNDKTYLISWDKNTIGSPINDIINFYNKRALDFDFISLLTEYEKINPLTSLEKDLYLINISLVDKISFTKKEYEDTHNIRMFLDKVFKSNEILQFEEKEKSTNEE